MDKNQVYDNIFKEFSGKGLKYSQMEHIFKKHLIGEWDGVILEEKFIQNSYSPKKAVEYAKKHYNNPNPRFPNYEGVGGDCANFVSQCLNAGGKPMVGSKSSDLNSWFCWTNNKWATDKISSTWRGASAFALHWRKSALQSRKFGPEYFETPESFKEIYLYGNRGDALSFLDESGKAYHTLLIVDYEDGDLICASRSYSTISRSLYDSAPVGGIIIFKMK